MEEKKIPSVVRDNLNNNGYDSARVQMEEDDRLHCVFDHILHLSVVGSSSAMIVGERDSFFFIYCERMSKCNTK